VLDREAPPMKLRPVIATTNGTARRCWSAPSPIAVPAITVAIRRPMRWMIGSSSSPAAQPEARDYDDAEHAMDRAQARQDHARTVEAPTNRGKGEDPWLSIYVTI
jgi:hypothetical protein